MSGPITSVPEIKRLLNEGWELWYIADPRGPLPGHWEMRYRNQVQRVHWDPIVKIQRNPNWFAENTTDEEVGRNWIYRAKQKAIQL